METATGKHLRIAWNDGLHTRAETDPAIQDPLAAMAAPGRPASRTERLAARQGGTR